VLETVRGSFRPEFLTARRRGGLPPLGTDQLQRIARIQLDHLQRRLADRRLTLDVTDRALTGSPGSAGNRPPTPPPRTCPTRRPLRRLVQTAIGDQLARAILAGEVLDGDTCG